MRHQGGTEEAPCIYIDSRASISKTGTRTVEGRCICNGLTHFDRKLATTWFKLLRSCLKLASNWFKLAPSCPKLSPFSFSFISSWPQVGGKGWIWDCCGIILEVRWSLPITLKALFGIWRLFWYTWESSGGHSGVALEHFGVTVESL